VILDANKQNTWLYGGAVHNTTDKALRKVTLHVTCKYEDGSAPKTFTKNVTFKQPGVAPNSHGTFTLTFPGSADENFIAANGKPVDAEFEPYEKPEREYGPKKGNILWTVGKVTRKGGNLAFQTSFLNNNANEDIVGINTYTLSFDHDKGKTVRYWGPWMLKNPLKAQGKSALTVNLNGASAFNNIRNAKISDVTYMTQSATARLQAEAKKAAANKAAASKKAAASGSGNVTYRVTSVAQGGGGYDTIYTATVEVLNNSSTQPLVRLDNIVISFNASPGYGPRKNYRSSFPTQTVNIPPLGTKQVKFRFGERMEQVGQVGFTATPRFGAAKQKKSGGTTIIIRD
jgi:hypothetical protein